MYFFLGVTSTEAKLKCRVFLRTNRVQGP